METTEKVRIEELSVGDWVQDRKGNTAQIIGIELWSDAYEVNVRIKGVDVGLVSASSCYPIPLAPEILEKNGFIDNGLGQHYLKCGNGITVRVGLSPLFHDGCWLVAADKEVDETIYTTCVLFDAKHVHELQRVMRLAKVGKEIEL